jgi:hypothetical protein
MIGRFEQFLRELAAPAEARPDVTVVFDKGNNSAVSSDN